VFKSNSTLTQKIFNIIRELYIFVFARPGMQRINDKNLELALHGRGYNNCCDPHRTGEEKFIELISRHNPTLCLDIGANTGTYSKRLLELTNTRVIAFEPLPDAFLQLKKIHQRFPDRFRAINKGVGDCVKSQLLFFGESSSTHATFSPEVNKMEYLKHQNTNTTTVQMVDLDSFMQNEIDFPNIQLDLIKIDTEGYEYEVLKGATRTIAQLRPRFIQIEFNLHQLHRNQTLLSLSALIPNYQAFQLLPHGSGLVKRDLSSASSNFYHYSNYVFIRLDVSI
jgi:FkbM family methyltransferase